MIRLLTAAALAALVAAGFVGLRLAASQDREIHTRPEYAFRPATPGLPGVPGAPNTSAPPKAAASDADRERVRQFWAVYKAATAEKQAGRWEKAIEGYRKAVELNPTHWDAYYYLGNALMETGRFREAEQAYLRLAKSDPQAARAYSALGALYSDPRAGTLFDLKKADREYHRAWRNNADESGSVLRLGEVAVAAGDFQKAREHLEAAGRTNFKSVSARFLLGYIAWKEGDLERARTLFRSAAKLTEVQKPPGGVLGEGDTKLPGYRAMVRPGQRGLFDGFIRQLWADRDGSPERMARLYKEVEHYIAALP